MPTRQGRCFLKKGSTRPPPQPSADDHGTLGVNAVDPKYVVRKIDANRDNFIHRTAPNSLWFMNHHFGT